MPTDILGDEVQAALRGASDYVRLGRTDRTEQHRHLTNLKAIERRLDFDVTQRETTYPTQLHTRESNDISERWTELNQNPRFIRANAEQQAAQQTFETLRQVNGGAFPRNISPVLYIIPLVLMGVAEWYVNFATFAAIFVPLFAIAGTVLVGAIFAWASHIHGAYIKQLSEILHPSVHYRNELGRKLALIIATILLIIAFATVVWLRYLVISDQLGISPGALTGTFGTPSSSMIWSRLGPTIVLNMLIWGLGMLYAWGMNEKVPGLREAYRELLRTNRKLDKARRPFDAEEKRIRAQYERDRRMNEVATKEYRGLLESVRGMIERVQA